MKTTEDSTRCSIAVIKERLKTICYRRRVDKTKKLLISFCLKDWYEWIQAFSHTCEAYSIPVLPLITIKLCPKKKGLEKKKLESCIYFNVAIKSTM